MYVVCSNCDSGLRVVGDAAEIKSLVSDRSDHPCFYCGCPCTVGAFADNDLLRVKNIRTVSPMEAHLAFEGMGLPSERECAAEIVETLLQSKQIKHAKVRSIPNTGRSVIDSIGFEDGTVMYLGASTHGALVYRIRRPHTYKENALVGQ